MYRKIYLALSVLISEVFAYDFTGLDIDVISPSSGVSGKIAQKIEKLLGRKVDAPTGDSDAQIFADGNAKFLKLDKSLRSKHKILWAIRGGYGMDKIMPLIMKLNYSNITKKVIIGYSDITPLMIYFSQKYGWIAINAPMLKDFVVGDKSKSSYQSVLNFLRNAQSSLKISDLHPINVAAKSKNPVIGKITGGNITCIISTIGTAWQIDMKEKIVFLEDTNVSGFRLDRLLTHMKNARLFNRAQASVFGDFGTDVSKILSKFASKLSIPVFKSTSFGHGRTNLPFVYNYIGTIKTTLGKTEIVMSN